MSQSGCSRTISSPQQGIHPRLHEVVGRHLSAPLQKPIAEHSHRAFEQAQRWLLARGGLIGSDSTHGALRAGERPLILDSCCGVGQSTARLAERFPDALVIGVDKSAHRLARHDSPTPTASNYLLLRADLNDFWRLAVRAGWQLSRHYLLYPNPWPKPAHLMRRWHGAPVFPELLRLGGDLELRSNWRLYLDEFQRALALAGRDSQLQALILPTGEREALTPFEAKYHASGHQLWQLISHTKN